MGLGVNGISDEVEPMTPPSWPFLGAHRTPLVVCCRRQPKIKPLLLKIYVVVQVRVDPT
jgi:hypothetical protein